MPEDWDFYFCNVNNVLASVFLDLGIRKFVPGKGKPNLLWVWVYLKWPRMVCKPLLDKCVESVYLILCPAEKSYSA